MILYGHKENTSVIITLLLQMGPTYWFKANLLTSIVSYLIELFLVCVPYWMHASHKWLLFIEVKYFRLTSKRIKRSLKSYSYKYFFLYKSSLCTLTASKAVYIAYDNYVNIGQTWCIIRPFTIASKEVS